MMRPSRFLSIITVCRMPCHTGLTTHRFLPGSHPRRARQWRCKAQEAWGPARLQRKMCYWIGGQKSHLGGKTGSCFFQRHKHVPGSLLATHGLKKSFCFMKVREQPHQMDFQEQRQKRRKASGSLHGASCIQSCGDQAGVLPEPGEEHGTHQAR